MCNEAFLIFAHNKTNNWLADLADTERDSLLKEAKTEGPKIRFEIQISRENKKNRIQKIDGSQAKRTGTS